jgi:IS5 family transposase
MRRKRENQLPLSGLWPGHRLAQELKAVSKILDDNPSILGLVLHDLCDTAGSGQGAPGLSAEQVLRAAILKNWHQLPYTKLAFLLSDSQSFRRFARLPWQWTPSASCLQDNISRIQAGTWQQINRLLVQWAEGQGLERGRKIRADATAVESPIPYPRDSQMLSDSVRVLTRWLRRLARPHKIVFSDHRRRAKRRCLNIANHRGKRRLRAYRDLLKVARKTAHYAERALRQADRFTDLPSLVIAGQLRHYLDLTKKIIDQTERRVLRGETVPAAEKVLSLFEEHTDIIKKGGRETVFGHKLFLTGGGSGLMLDGEVVRGNPADAAQFQPWRQRQFDLYGRWPRQVSFDGCFASRANLEWAKAQGIQDVAFAKKGRLKVDQMVRSDWVYRQLRRFRAGIEGCISMLKRVFGVGRCTWRGWPHFQQYVYLSITSFNLLVLARLLL